jgi:signal peptidase I
MTQGPGVPADLTPKCANGHERIDLVKPAPDYPWRWLPDGTPVEQAEDRLAKKPGPPRKKPLWLSVVEWGLLVVSALLIAFLIKTFLFQAFYIPSDSMLPTLRRDDRVLVNKLSYKLHPVHRGDIVVFTAPPGVDPHVKDLVKRVIGLPGETISARTGHVYIDGHVLPEPYLPKGTYTDFFGLGPYKVPPDEYFVMGDNRGNSHDSRLFPSHAIRKKDIVGRVFIRIWPLSRVDLL